MITQFNEPRTDVKSVLCFYHGKFPKISRPTKDISLPHRLFPNAKLIIRCKDNYETHQYLLNIFKNECNGFSNIEFIPDKLNATKIDAEVLFMQQDAYMFFGGKVEKQFIINSKMLYSWEREAYVFYNDENIPVFDDLYNIIRSKNSAKFQEYNNILFFTIKHKPDWSNVSILANENKLSNWMEDRISPLLDNINTCYLNDTILYDLKKPTIKWEKTNNEIKGIFIGSFHKDREKAFNKIFDGSQNLNLSVYGNNSDELDAYTGSGEYIDNVKSKSMLSAYSWSFYMGKGTKSLYLGATFYEPLLNNCPIFVWHGTDPEHKLFPHLDVYFKNEQELAAKLKDITHEKLMNLLQLELEHIFK